MADNISKSNIESRTAQQQSTSNKAAGGMDDAREKVREKTSEKAHQLREKAEEGLSSQKHRATDQISSVSSALRDTSANLRNRDQDSIAGIVESAAEQVDRLSGYVRDRSVGELVDEVEDIARREPALFLGGAALLGIFGARFLKSSERRRMRTSDRGGTPYGDTRYGDTRYIDRDRVRSRETSIPRSTDTEPYRTGTTGMEPSPTRTTDTEPSRTRTDVL